MGKHYSIMATSLLVAATMIFWFNGCGQKVVPDTQEVELFSSITGTTTDSITNAFIPGVTITQNSHKFITDSTGRYLINNLARGGYTLKFSLTGYEELTKEITLALNSQSVADVALNRLPLIDQVTTSSIKQNSALVTFQTFSSSGSNPLTMITNAFIRYSLDPDNLNQVSATSNTSISHSISLSGLQSSKTYYFKIEASDPANSTVANTSTLFTFKTDDGNAPTITSEQIKLFTDSVEFRWLTSESSTGKVYYGESEATVSGKGQSIGTDTTLVSELSTDHFISLGGLKPKTKYFYQLESKDGAGNSTTQDIKSFTTPELFAPILNKPSNLTKTTASLFWILNSDPNKDNLHFKEYKLRVFTTDPTNNATASTTQTITLNEKLLTYYRVTNLLANTKYFFRISTVDLGGNESNSGVVEAVTSSDGVHFDDLLTSAPLNQNVNGVFVRKASLADGSDAKGWMVGRQGQSARLTNSGSTSASITWSLVTTPTVNDLLSVDGSSTQGAAVGKLGTLLFSSDNQNWVAVSAGTNQTLNDVHRHTSGTLADTFWYCGNQTIGVMSLNGGTPGVNINTGFGLVGSGTWNGICAVENLLMLVGDSGVIASASISATNASAALLTASASFTVLDLNSNFRAAGPNPSLGTLNSQASQTNNLRGIDLVSTTDGWIVGDRGVILHLKSGSNQWFADPIEFDLKENIMAVDAIDTTLAYAVTDLGKILKFENNTGKWVVINTFPTVRFKTIGLDPDISKQFGIAAGETSFTPFRVH